LKTGWNCPNCQESSTRNWNIKRHIQRRHGGMGEPVRYGTMQYYKDMNPRNFHFPFAYSHHVPSSSLIRKKKSDNNFSEFLEHQILQPLRRMVEFKDLISQLFTTQQQQQRIMPGSGSIAYPSIPSTAFDSGESKNNLSEHSRIENDDYSEIVGFRGHVCEKCSTINIDTIFRHNDGESGQIETKHTCNSKTLSDIHLNPGKDKIITNQYEKLIEYMKKKVISWTKNSAYLVALEMPPDAAVNNSFEITPTDDSHWAARAIKNKRTTLTDKELSDFLHIVRDSHMLLLKSFHSLRSSNSNKNPQPAAI
jgi:hypothetical protein